MMPIRRFLHGLTFRIMGVFLLVLFVANGVIALTVRQRIKKDLEAGTKADLLNGLNRLESDLNRQRDTAALFAEIAAHAALGTGVSPRRRSDAPAFQIAVVERSRAQGIRIDEMTQGAADPQLANLLLRGYAGMPTVDYAVRGDGAGPLHMIAVAPVEEGRGPRRVMTASIPLERDFLRREKESLGGDVTILYPGGLLASSSPCAECIACMKRVLLQESLLKMLAAGKPLYFTWDCVPEPQAAAVLPLRTFDGRTVAIALSRSRGSERQALNHATAGIVLGSVLLAAVVSAAFYLPLSRTTRPLRDLTRMAGAISEGRYGETVDVRGRDEIADLAQAFNRMSLSQKKAMEENAAWNAQLESRVEEKSRELAKVHRQMVDVEKLAAMGQLSAGVAHEINNPLSGILGYAELGLEVLRKTAPKEGLPEADTSKLESYFSQIESLSHRCRVIILDMLRFARQHTEETREIDLNAAILQTLVFVDKQLGPNDISVVTQLGADLPILQGNVLQLQQVFTNIILNSVQAMPVGGTIVIRTAVRRKTVEAEFEDTGSGIPEEHLHRIFDPFFTTKPVGEGTGLGLSVSYGIVKQHGGEIRVASEVGKGTTFTVVLPTPATVRIPS